MRDVKSVVAVNLAALEEGKWSSGLDIRCRIIHPCSKPQVRLTPSYGKVRLASSPTDLDRNASPLSSTQ